jgi:glycine hydroxymethyltransferase
MKQIGHWISQALNNRADTAALKKIRGEVLELCEQFPLYASRRQHNAEMVTA